MFNFFYAKMALQNIQKNRRVYLPYMLAAIFTVAAFYNMCAIASDEALAAMPGANTLSSIMFFGMDIVGIFSVIFLCYTNSFLMKRRQKELALYNILGMEKRHIAKMLVWESIFSGVISIVAGLAAGIVCSKLLLLILFRALFFEVHFGLTIQLSGIILVLILFAAIFVLNLVINLVRMRIFNPVELMTAESGGEKEPKVKWVLVVTGIITLGAGYVISWRTKSPYEAISMFFIAVVLVIIGTYCLFTAVSILVLKSLRKNKSFYYKPNHFTLVGGMLYRMKQNAVGLANICILSTMVLVMVSTTVSLFAGFGDMLNSMYPNEFAVMAAIYSKDETVELKQLLQSECEKMGLEVTGDDEYEVISALMKKNGNEFSYMEEYNGEAGEELTIAGIVSKDLYENMTGEQVDLAENEVLVSCSGESEFPQSIEINQKEYAVKQWIEDFTVEVNYNDNMLDTYYIVVSSTEKLEEINRELNREGSQLTWYYGVDFEADEEEAIAFYEHMQEVVAGLKASDGKMPALYENINLRCRQDGADKMYSVCGGFLFLGTFLGIVFLMGTVLIMYYKQISEGYEDKRRFEIMQKVGMGKDEVRRTIRCQVLTVFFLPLVVAVLHLCMAFPMVEGLIEVFNLKNVTLFILCSLITVVVFAAIYCIVYILTAKVYYRIVSTK